MTELNKRPRCGLSLEEAFRRWGDPATFEVWDQHQDAWQPVSMENGAAPNERVRRHRIYADAFGKLQDQLTDLLKAGQIFASAIRGGGEGREIIKPSLWEDLEFFENFNEAHSANQRFLNLEYFARGELPLNIEEIPAWWSQDSNDKSSRPFFRPNPNYRHIGFGDKELRFGPRQAAAIQVLHMAWKEGQPWLDGKVIMGKIGSPGRRLRDLFDSNKNWKLLIESDERGQYRLRLYD